MISITDYLVCESLDVDNLLYKVDTWFAKNDDEKSSFYDMIKKFKDDNVVNKNVIKNYLDSSNLKVKSFVDYLSDDIYGNEIQDYMYVFNKIIDTLVADKRI